MDPPYSRVPAAEKCIDGSLLGTLFLQTHGHRMDGMLGTGLLRLLRATWGPSRILTLRRGWNAEKRNV